MVDLDEAAGVIRVVAGAGRDRKVVPVALDQVAHAVIRVEFRPAPQDELDLLSEPGEPGRGAREGEDR